MTTKANALVGWPGRGVDACEHWRTPALVPISAGRTISNVTPRRTHICDHKPREALSDTTSNDSSESGFDSLESKFVVDGNSSFTFQTESLDSAEAFFTDNSLANPEVEAEAVTHYASGEHVIPKALRADS